MSNLERYPAHSFFIINEYQWDEIVKFRYEKTKPIKGIRLQPAVSDKFMLEVEERNPHLRQSKVSDQYVWKDCVNSKFKKGGLSRPKGLLYPYTVVLQLLDDALIDLNSCLCKECDEKAVASALRSIETISESPMDLSILKGGIGKKVKKFLGKSSKLEFMNEPYVYSTGKDMRKTPRTTLEATLNSWMDIAAESGVKMKSGESSQVETNNSSSKAVPISSQIDWRTLYQTLKQHDEDQRSRQGEKMRERRRKLDTVRPKIVKVRHATYKQDRILNRQSFGSGFNRSRANDALSGSAKIRQLRMEATVTSARRAPPSVSTAVSKSRSSFGAAVAFAAVGKKVTSPHTKSSPKCKAVFLAGGKRMNVPDVKAASINVQKRLKMLKKGQSNFRS